jgi:nitroimidazol reductase NimA-like FMN-containing flavoprotein (pyridoxamine 5'-phosphate oxidase superfamily)
MSQDELGDLARTVIDANRYMALGTADEAGHPWVSPVWFASEDYRQFHWVSSPEARHSQNLSARRTSRLGRRSRSPSSTPPEHPAPSRPST